MVTDCAQAPAIWARQQQADIVESRAPGYVGQDSDLDPMFFEDKPEKATQEPLDAEQEDLLEMK